MAKFLQFTPFLHISDLDAAVVFFTGIFGFAVLLRSGNYAYLERDGLGLRMLSYGPGDPELPRGDRRWAYYVGVDDLDTLYAEWKPKLDRLPSGDVHGPVNQEYGQRELMVVVPDGNIMVFGQAIVH